MLLVILPVARRELGNLGRDVTPRIAAAIDALTENPRPPGSLHHRYVDGVPGREEGIGALHL